MKKWFLCPYCGKKLVLYAKGAKSKGIYMLCKKCKNEIEIKVNNDEIKSLN